MVVWYEKIVTRFRIKKFQIKKNKKVKRSLSILFTYITVLGFIIMILAFVIPELAKSIANLVNALPDFFSTDFVNKLTVFIEDKSSQFEFIDPAKVEATIKEYIPSTIDSAKDIVPSIMNSVFDITKKTLLLVSSMLF